MNLGVFWQLWMKQRPQMNGTDDLTPPQRRHARTKAKLRAALETLSSDPAATVTAAAVAREAGVGRNVLYVGHTDILDGIRAISDGREAARTNQEHNTRTGALKIQHLESKLASLATENAGLLRRAREAEIKLERAEKHNGQLRQQLSEAHRPVRLHPEPSDKSKHSV
jgi:chromosome segregation ATPase